MAKISLKNMNDEEVIKTETKPETKVKRPRSQAQLDALAKGRLKKLEMKKQREEEGKSNDKPKEPIIEQPKEEEKPEPIIEKPKDKPIIEKPKQKEVNFEEEPKPPPPAPKKSAIKKAQVKQNKEDSKAKQIAEAKRVQQLKMQEEARIESMVEERLNKKLEEKMFQPQGEKRGFETHNPNYPMAYNSNPFHVYRNTHAQTNFLNRLQSTIQH